MTTLRAVPLSLLRITVSLGVAGTLAGGAPVMAQTTTGDSFQWSGKIPAGATLTIRTVDGNIGVTPATGDQADIHGEQHYDRPGDRALVFQMIKDGDNITVCAYAPDNGSCSANGMSSGSHYGRWESTARAFFTVRVPAGVKLVTKSGDGRIEIRGPAGGAEITAGTGDGDVRIEDATGPVTALTGDGSVSIATSVGPVNASTGDGSVEVRVASLPHPQDMRIRTGDGSITLYLPSTFAGELDAHTGDGHIDSDFPLQVNGRLDSNRIHATIGTGGTTRIDLSTGNGDVKLRRN